MARLQIYANLNFNRRPIVLDMCLRGIVLVTRAVT